MCVRGEVVGEEGVGAPPEGEEGAEEEGGGEAVVEAAEAVVCELYISSVRAKS